MSLTFIHEDGQGGKLVDGEGMDVDEEEGEVKQLITLSTMATKKAHSVTGADASMHSTGTPERNDAGPTGSNSSEDEEDSIKCRGPRGQYRSYTEQQMEELIRLTSDLQISMPKAAQKIGMTASTAYRHIKTYQDDPERRLPGTRKQYVRKPGRKATLDDVHTAFLIKTMEECSTLTLASLKQKISEEFGIE
ncbi:hypothetical protein BG005_011234, partial [Podila minutissima]